jgi:hypothetical protein
VVEVAPTLVPPPDPDDPLVAAMADPGAPTLRAFANPADLVEPGVVDTDRWRPLIDAIHASLG